MEDSKCEGTAPPREQLLISLSVFNSALLFRFFFFCLLSFFSFFIPFAHVFWLVSHQWPLHQYKRNESLVIVYSSLCRSKPVWHFFLSWITKGEFFKNCIGRWSFLKIHKGHKCTIKLVLLIMFCIILKHISSKLCFFLLFSDYFYFNFSLNFI